MKCADGYARQRERSSGGQSSNHRPGIHGGTWGTRHRGFRLYSPTGHCNNERCVPGVGTGVHCG
jgi:hypothetical protein